MRIDRPICPFPCDVYRKRAWSDSMDYVAWSHDGSPPPRSKPVPETARPTTYLPVGKVARPRPEAVAHPRTRRPLHLHAVVHAVLHPPTHVRPTRQAPRRHPDRENENNHVSA